MKKDLLSRFKQINEYNIRFEKKSMSETEDTPMFEEDGELDTTEDDNEIGSDMEDEMASGLGDEMPSDLEDEMNEPEATEVTAEVESDSSDDEGEVEIDVTDLVDKTDQVQDYIKSLESKVGELESKLTVIDSLGSKLNDLGEKIDSKFPSQETKLKLSSLSAYPYSKTVDDFWDEKGSEGNYSIEDNSIDNHKTEKEHMVSSEEDKKEEDEYIITKTDIDSEYNESEIKKKLGY